MLVGAGGRCVLSSTRAVTLLPLRAVVLPSVRVRGPCPRGAGGAVRVSSARAVTLLPLWAVMLPSLRAVTLSSARARGHGHPAHRTPVPWCREQPHP